MKRSRVAILISGRGSNMAALIAAAKAPDYPAEIVGVIANKTTAPGLATASAEGIATAIVLKKDFDDTLGADRAIDRQLRDWRVDLICLAGFMRLLTPWFCQTWANRVLNIHPALLPAFPGLDTHARALAAGASEHGCTVHYVTAGMDEGPVIGQARVPVLPGDTPQVLAARVLAEEHRLYPACLADVARKTARQ